MLREKSNWSLLAARCSLSSDKGISAATRGSNSGGKNGYDLAISSEVNRKKLLFLNTGWFAKSYGKK